MRWEATGLVDASKAPRVESDRFVGRIPPPILSRLCFVGAESEQTLHHVYQTLAEPSFQMNMPLFGGAVESPGNMVTPDDGLTWKTCRLKSQC